MLVLCNPTVAVELLAASAAQRARTTDVELSLDDESDHAAGEPDGEPDGAAGERDGAATNGETRGSEAPGPLERMDAFARRVGFTPTHLPRWLTGTSSVLATNHRPAEPAFTFDWSRLLPSLTLNLHLAQEVLTSEPNGVVRWDGEGPVTGQFVHDHLRPLHSYVIQPVIDLAAQAPVDAYEIPDRHRRAVRLRTPADCSPFSAHLADDRPGEMDVDHTEEYDAAQAAMEWVASSLSMKDLLSEAKESTGRVTELVAAVKSYSQLDRASLQMTDIVEGLESTLVMLAHKLPDSVAVVREYADVPPIEAMAGELNQVWTNLIDNAVDAMKGGGTLRVSTRLDDSGWVDVQIADTGAGMPPDVQARAFEPFFTTKDVGKGTGLGLDISRRIVVERHSGEITIESRPGHTLMRVRLPPRH